MAHFDLTDFEWSVIQPLLPNKPRGVLQVDGRLVSAIFWRLRAGAPRADIPVRYGPHTTCVNRFNRMAQGWRGGSHSDGGFRGLKGRYPDDRFLIDSDSPTRRQR